MSSNLSGFSPRFYCVDFDLPNFVISIKDPMPVSREKKKWGHRRIAVEGEIIDHSPSLFSQQAVIFANSGPLLYVFQCHCLLIQGNILAVQVWGLTGDILLCSWARHFTLTVPLSTQVYKSRLLLSFESLLVALFSTHAANLLLCGWILSAKGNFTHSSKGKWSILNCNRCYRLRPLMTALHMGTCKFNAGCNPTMD